MQCVEFLFIYLTIICTVLPSHDFTIFLVFSIKYVQYCRCLPISSATMRRMFGLLASAEAEPESESEDAFSLFSTLTQSERMLLYRGTEVQVRIREKAWICRSNDPARRVWIQWWQSIVHIEAAGGATDTVKSSQLSSTCQAGGTVRQGRWWFPPRTVYPSAHHTCRGHSPPTKLGRKPCLVSSLRLLASVICTVGRAKTTCLISLFDPLWFES